MQDAPLAGRPAKDRCHQTIRGLGSWAQPRKQAKRNWTAHPRWDYDQVTVVALGRMRSTRPGLVGASGWELRAKTPRILVSGLRQVGCAAALALAASFLAASISLAQAAGQHGSSPGAPPSGPP